MQTCEPNNKDKFPFIILANKSDKTAERKITADIGKKFCKDNGMQYFETSARDNIGVEAAFS